LVTSSSVTWARSRGPEPSKQGTTVPMTRRGRGTLDQIIDDVHTAGEAGADLHDWFTSTRQMLATAAEIRRLIETG
jgi:hypothetical protein